MFSQYFYHIPKHWIHWIERADQYLERTIWVVEKIDWFLLILNILILPVVNISDKFNANHTLS